jgi:hypothetical protein
MDCKTVIGLPPVTSVVFLIVKSFWSTVGVTKEYVYLLGDEA